MEDVIRQEAKGASIPEPGHEATPEEREAGGPAVTHCDATHAPSNPQLCGKCTAFRQDDTPAQPTWPGHAQPADEATDITARAAPTLLLTSNMVREA